MLEGSENILEENIKNFFPIMSKKEIDEMLNLPDFDGEEMLCISVKDSGVGMSREEMSKLFTLFTHIDGSRKINTKGIGLGLVISKKIVE